MYPVDVFDHGYLSQLWCFEGDGNVELKILSS